MSANRQIMSIAIPTDFARRYANILRGGPYAGRMEALRGLADLLDPPPAPSLRDELNHSLATWEIDLILAVVRRHIEALEGYDGGWLIDKADVLRLLDGE